MRIARVLALTTLCFLAAPYQGLAVEEEAICPEIPDAIGSGLPDGVVLEVSGLRLGMTKKEALQALVSQNPDLKTFGDKPIDPERAEETPPLFFVSSEDFSRSAKLLFTSNATGGRLAAIFFEQRKQGDRFQQPAFLQEMLDRYGLPSHVTPVALYYVYDPERVFSSPEAVLRAAMSAERPLDRRISQDVVFPGRDVDAMTACFGRIAALQRRFPDNVVNTLRRRPSYCEAVMVIDAMPGGVISTDMVDLRMFADAAILESRDNLPEVTGCVPREE